MKSSAPWSVKGVERDARETAKEAARREGMTVGEWLNQIIYTAGDPPSSNGQIEGLKISDLVNAIEHVSKRVIGAETNGAAAIDEFARNFASVVERVQRLERIRPAAVGDEPGLGERISRLEEKGGDRQRVETLKALEKAVAQIGLQFDTAQKSSSLRLESLERHVQEFAGRLDGATASGGATTVAAIDHLKTTIDGLGSRLARIERASTEAARQRPPEATPAAGPDPEFIERTSARLRVLGDEIKRGGDQIRSLDAVIKRLSEQIDGAERRSSEGVQKVAETISELRVQMHESDVQKAPDPRADIDAAMAESARRTEQRINQLQRSFEAVVARLEEAARGAAPTTRLADVSAGADEDFDLEIAEGGADDLGADDDDLAFDLDADTPASPESEERAEAAGILKEVEEAFAGRTAAPANDTAARSLDEDLDGIDTILAELEGLGAPADAPAETLLQSDFARAARPAAVETPIEPQSAPANFLQEARRVAKDANEKAAEEAQTRRKLTPKQRAILAAKIRRKRLAAEQGLGPVATHAPEPPAAPVAPTDAFDEAKPAPESLIAKAIGKARGFLPGARASAARDRMAVDETQISTGPARRPRLSAGVKPKPVALAMGAAIVLAGAALFFLVKDMFGGREKATEAPRQASVNDQASPPQLKDSSATPEVPAPPVVKPRALYLDSVARLKAAGNEAETESAIKSLEEAAALGHPPAQLQLGELYKLGQGVPQDAGQARAWYERSATGGNVLAMHRIGVMAARGQGGAADQDAAIGWFEKAASLGLVDSQYNLGALYHPGGEGAAAGAQDVAKAYFWYSLASRNGDDQAGALAAGLASGLSADDRRKADENVAAWTATTPDPDANEVAPAT